jgi:putative exosortase-associated protein (TIGR04073 family)
MKKFITALAVSLLAVAANPAFATDVPKPESIAEKMSFKLVRGITNFATAIVEIPKQTILTAENHGEIGYVVGPIKGVGMTLYRAFIGVTEAVFFMVPQPGYYDPMIDPEFVWQGWDSGKKVIATGESAPVAKPVEQPATQAADNVPPIGDR